MRSRLLLTAALLLGVSCRSTDTCPRCDAAPLDQAAVAAVGAVVTDLYAVISGPAGEARDWERMLSLFAEDARMTAIVQQQDGMRPYVIAPADYVARIGPNLERDGFFEQEIAREVQLLGDFAHVWSTYEGRRALDDEEPFLRGINSIQLVRTDGAWRVHSILWEQEHDAGPIPQRYLPR